MIFLLIRNYLARAKSTWMMKGNVTHYPHDQCIQKFRDNSKFVIIEKQFCANSEVGIDSCQVCLDCFS